MTFEQFQTKYGARVVENEPMSKHTTFRLGGPAKFFFEARTSEELVDAVRAARESNLKFAILGGGCNSLFLDAGFDGLVIVAANRKFSIVGSEVTAEAGVLMTALAREVADRGLTGFEWAATLPGTLGGAIRGNAGCFGGETKDFLISVKVYRDGKIIELSNADCRFGYRDSAFKHNSDLLLEATFEFETADPATVKTKIAELLEKRKTSQPLGTGSAGCMFKNFEWSEVSAIRKLQNDREVPKQFLEQRRIPAGWLIEQAELKGFCVGDACVSGVHGNFLLNKSGATADQILQLVAAVKTRIRDRFGILLEEEVQLFS
ncbi:MAG: UDP-N-acetylmuramate dehydrogenase [bacterium]